MKKKSSLPLFALLLAAVCCAVTAMAQLTGCSNATPCSAPCLQIRLVARGFTHPTACAAPRDGSGRLFVTEQTGTVKIIQSSGAVNAAAFLDISDRIVRPSAAYDESGLLGLAFHPDYGTNGRFFVFYTALPTAATPAGFHSNIHVSEFLVSSDNPDRAEPASEKVLFEIPNPQANHNGGQLAFGPDGYLYVGIGDGGGSNDVADGHTPDLGNGQDTTTLLGKILRLDVSVPGVASIPGDNPFAGDSLNRQEIFAYGLRNPWRFSFDTVTGRLFCGDVGQNLYEEIDIVTAGGNYGWNIREGTACFNKDDAANPPETCPAVGADGSPLLDPVISYGRPGSGGLIQGRSVAGGYVYRGALLPGLAGYYVFGDWSTSFSQPDGSVFIAREESNGTWQAAAVSVSGEGTRNNRLGRFLLSFGEDEAGELYLLASTSLGPAGSGGEVYKIVGADLQQGAEQ